MCPALASVQAAQQAAARQAARVRPAGQLAALLLASSTLFVGH